MGPNGAGKSTIIRHFTGVYRPDSGQVTLDGQPVYENPAAKSRMAVIPDDWYYFPQASIRDMARLYAGTHPFFSWDRYHKLREAFPLPEKQLLRRMSKGMQKQAAFWLVMSCMPEVLVLDEPAAGLDPEGRDTILSQIRDYHEKTGITVLLVSHSMEDIAKYANRVLVMHRAKIAMYDTVENVFARAQELLELGLSVPQVTQIFLKLRQMGLDIPADVYTIPYAVKTIQKALAAKQGGGANA